MKIFDFILSKTTPTMFPKIELVPTLIIGELYYDL